jgi:predicted peptidase
MKASFATGLVVVLSVAVHGQQMDSLWYSSGGTTLRYGFYTPAGQAPAEGFPLVVGLHGVGERGTNLINISTNGLDSWYSAATQGEHPCYVLLPQCPGSGQWVDVPTWYLESYSIDVLPQSGSLAAVSALIDSLIAALPVDTDRVYMTGLSMGGYGAWDMILRYPNRFAAAVPVCGAGDPTKASLITHLPVWACHGQSDGVVPPSGSRNMVFALRDLGRTPAYTDCEGPDCSGLSEDSVKTLIETGADLLYSEFQGVGHSSWTPAYADTLLKDWLFAQQRDQAEPVSESAAASRAGVRRVTAGGCAAHDLLGRSWENATVSAGVCVQRNGHLRVRESAR